ncbi:MAG: TrkH family potassium uptake protein [Alphaproteobacteria bacterium]|nr:TrkH family potassium uptake protein [Alphaproteobacteria bacterium]
MNFRPILFINGLLITILGASMLIPMFTDFYYGHDDWKVFALCIMFTVFFGGILTISNHSRDPFQLNVRQGFLITATSWLSISIFGSIPFWFSALDLSFTDSAFEAISGITTTGSTIIVGLDNAPPGILIWRALLQWLGGIGIIVMALSILPLLKVGGMQLFKTESSENEKALPRARDLAIMICFIYLALTAFCFVAYRIVGMGVFDAIAHSMTTIATGGFSTRDDSMGAFAGTGADLVAILFILISALPFVLYLKAIKGKAQPLLKDSQVRVFFGFIAVITLFSSFHLSSVLDIPLLDSIRLSLFSVVTIITGTGFTNADFSGWSAILTVVFFFMMFVGGCAGSTTCSIKIFRYQILFSTIKHQIKRLTHPNGVFITRYNGQAVSDDVPLSVIGFVCLYLLSFAAIALCLLLTGLDITTSLSGAATSISNVGPGLGDIIGPTGTFQPLSNTAKWILSIGMLLGRLELFTLFVLFSPRFWR